MNYKNVIQLIFIITILLISFFSNAQKLDRRASWQARISGPTNNDIGATIIFIEENSPLKKAGLLPEDVIIKVDDLLITDDQEWTEATYNIRETNPVSLQVLRKNTLIEVKVKLNPISKEKHKGIDTFYEEITSSYGITQRTIITKPRKKGKQPAIILIGGLSCSSIEIHPGRNSNWSRVMRDLVEKSDMIVMRVEKPGVGDSQGNCSESDFLMDLAGYRAAIYSLKSKPYVNTSKIIVYGSSLGSTLAPLLANEFGLAGVISDGVFFKTWYEHMLEIERRILQMKGDTETEIVEKMNAYYIPLYYGMLIEKKTFQEIVNQYPALAKFNYHGSRHMYGRPVEYYQQLQNFNLAGEWEKIKVPVRIMRGTNDWIMSSFDNKMIINVLRKNGHKDHILYEYQGLDHWNTIHKTAKDSYEGKEGKWEDKISLQIIEWAREMVGL